MHRGLTANSFTRRGLERKGKEVYNEPLPAGQPESRRSGYLQEAVPAAQEVVFLHDGVRGEDQLVLTERRLVWTGVDRLGRVRWNIHITFEFEAMSACTRSGT